MKIQLVCDGRPTGSDYNMALDEWLLAQAIANPDNVYLRLYAWSRPTITFGVNQKEGTAVDHEQLGETPLIRRVTGGRALYHDSSELTYSIAFNTDRPPCEALSGTVSETSGVIAEGLRQFLQTLGIESDWVKRSSPANSRPEFFHKAACFESSARYELKTDLGKIVASAQRRFRGALVQHGSIKLCGVVAHPALGAVGESGEKSQPVGEKEFNDFAKLFGELFASYLGGTIARFEFSESERSSVAKYGDWVKRNRRSNRLVCADGLAWLGIAPQAV